MYKDLREFIELVDKLRVLRRMMREELASLVNA